MKIYKRYQEGFLIVTIDMKSCIIDRIPDLGTVIQGPKVFTVLSGGKPSFLMEVYTLYKTVNNMHLIRIDTNDSKKNTVHVYLFTNREVAETKFESWTKDDARHKRLM